MNRFVVSFMVAALALTSEFSKIKFVNVVNVSLQEIDDLFFF